MDIINFIIQQNAEKFINDTKDDLWKYKRFLEKQKGAKAKRLLQAVNKKLGYEEEDVAQPVTPKKSKEDQLIIQEGIQAIKDHFDF